MADRKKRGETEIEKEEHQASGPDVETGECGAECVGCEGENLAEKLAAKEDSYLRLLAEYDNFRKRSLKEREQVYSIAAVEVIGAFLPVLDNIERACARDEADEGVKMILKQLLEILTKFGVKSVGERGEAFDPMLHNAVAHDGEHGGESKIAEVLQKGYTAGDKLLRPAMVKTEG